MATRVILEATTKCVCILDAGAEIYSTILPWLFLYGCRNMLGINPVFDRPVKRGRSFMKRAILPKPVFAIDNSTRSLA